jgi:hypothetical protein
LAKARVRELAALPEINGMRVDLPIDIPLEEAKALQ